MEHISLDENWYETLLPKNSHGSSNFDTAAYTNSAVVVKSATGKLARALPNWSNASLQITYQSNLTHYDETKKIAHDSQTVRHEENGGSRQRQTSGTNQTVKV